MTTPFLTEPQCAQLLGVSLNTLRRLAVTGKIPYFKVGSRRRYEVETVKAKLGRGTK